MPSNYFEIVEDPIDTKDIIQKVEDRNAGAITTFIGTVREMTGEKRTIYLEYQAYKPMAEKMLEQIGQEINDRWPGTHVAITHRIGSLAIADIAVVIAVSSPNRKPAYEANEYAIERIKQIVPIWKKEQWEDGAAWIGDQLENVSYPTGKPETNGGDHND
ncbi:molybdenum cofactor biosynthesis protein MoaE [Gracilibacillus salinarum]|uniref:Molybdenum cofactor biosynthesis protein MoaE n=1 Tax=Gracilibacillus salinarum TaxID=2932255 RepID=A0ABY4GLR8_9BACI|nr:molybdenum cofactor biosynthesis protein MoaE [Gracilibacillus salinarum]UOQ85315.1 molybdenum cofactor biosynthesis protein MoaE [Gracilibacillus salinarum]